MAQSSSEKQSNWASSRLIKQREELCARFESALRLWKQGSGECPKSEDFLVDVPETRRWDFLHCLLLLEEDYRRNAGEDDDILREFHSRFPDFSSRIAIAFSDQSAPKTRIVPTDSSEEHQQQVREYVLQEKIGWGGMGVVWKAWHIRLKKHRAIKVLHSHLLESPEVRDRFLNEIEALARFEHPNIVRAHDAFEESGELYLVMEYVDGCNMFDLVREHGKLEVGAACEVIHQAAHGLAALHDQHVTHRDIKPSNLMLARDPESKKPVVKVMDLGLSQIDTGRILTHAGDLLGTCAFMAPEQWENARDVGPAADIYALGCSLFYILSGSPPYTAEGNAAELMLAHRRRPVPRLSEVCREGDQLQPLLERMMAKKSDRRFNTAFELLDEIAPFARREELVSVMEEKCDTVSHHQLSKDTQRVPGYRPTRWMRPWIKWLIVACMAVALVASLVIKIRQFHSTQRLQTLHVQAANAAVEYGNEIERRLNMLQKSATDKNMHEMLLATKDADIDSPDIRNLLNWLGSAKATSGLSEQEQLKTTWFITDADGRQVARVPRGKSLGRDIYWTRSYFHGKPNDLDAAVDNNNSVQPIRTQTVSSPYLSSSEGKWKIAFSVPIFASSTHGSDQPPIGVLSMSIKLEDFEWFTADVEDSTIALVELFREDWLAKGLKGQVKVGQIIDHTDLFAAMAEENAEGSQFCIAPGLVAQLQELRQQRLKAFRRGEKKRKLCENCISKNYLDPVAANPSLRRRAAFEPVFVPGSGHNLTNIGWVVVAQDFYPSDRHAQ